MLSHGTGARFAGVLGWPLTHTLSPAIHNASFAALGLDAVYLPFPVPPGDLFAAVAGLRALGALGANITMPHKQSVAGMLDELADEVVATGAVNTVQRVGNRLVGHNTDVRGFRDFLVLDAGVDVRGVRALVLGAGGAARAVVAALDETGAAEIVVCARHAIPAGDVAGVARSARASSSEWARAAELAATADVVVNATPIGMGERGDPLPEVTFTPSQVVVDLVSEPLETTLVRRARSGGARAWGGLGMLVRQGAASFRIWTGLDAPLETMMAAAQGSIDAPSHRLGPRE
ncbi:shikimate dehydrogenase [soil metagenome]